MLPFSCHKKKCQPAVTWPVSAWLSTTKICQFQTWRYELQAHTWKQLVARALLVQNCNQTESTCRFISVILLPFSDLLKQHCNHKNKQFNKFGTVGSWRTGWQKKCYTTFLSKTVQINNPQLEADSFHLSISNIKGTLLCHMKKFSKAYIISIPVKLYNARLPQ